MARQRTGAPADRVEEPSRPHRLVILTPNPALDRTVAADGIRLARHNRTRLVAQQAGGKGLNVARVLRTLGVDHVVGVAPVGGPEGEELLRLARADGLDLRPVATSGRTRLCIVCRTRGGETVELNESGDVLSPAIWAAVVAAVIDLLAPGDRLVVCGSFPPGVDEAGVTDLIGRAKLAGAHITVDTSGRMLMAAIEARPHLVVPNLFEAREVLAAPDATAGELGADLLARGVPALLTDGVRGAVLVDEVGTLTVPAPRVHVRSSVGAGDALLAGWLAARLAGKDRRDALHHAVAAGAAACEQDTAGAVDPVRVAALAGTH